jgi:GNAT superfamily N-acetyltransferase
MPSTPTPGQRLVVAMAGYDVVGTEQLSFILGLVPTWRATAQIEAVRVREDFGSRGLGHAMFKWTIGEARRRGCALVQVAIDKTRAKAHCF